MNNEQPSPIIRLQPLIGKRLMLTHKPESRKQLRMELAGKGAADELALKVFNIFTFFLTIKNKKSRYF